MWAGRQGRQGGSDGWSKLTGHDVADLAQRFEGYGVEAIFTQISP